MRPWAASVCGYPYCTTRLDAESSATIPVLLHYFAQLRAVKGITFCPWRTVIAGPQAIPFLVINCTCYRPARVFVIILSGMVVGIPLTAIGELVDFCEAVRRRAGELFHLHNLCRDPAFLASAAGFTFAKRTSSVEPANLRHD